jgi:hypothetical protein
LGLNFSTVGLVGFGFLARLKSKPTDCPALLELIQWLKLGKVPRHFPIVLVLPDTMVDLIIGYVITVEKGDT